MAGALSPREVESLVRRELSHRLSRRPPAAAAVTDDSSLAELGLESLDLLELVDALEATVGVNPFDETFALTDVRTVHDLVHAYQSVLGASGPISNDGDLLQRSRRRAEARQRHRNT